MDIPEHVGIIMDGNGRWAQKQDLPRRAGHKKGVEVLKKIVKESSRLKIPCLTVYAFSTENWNRPSREVKFLMKLFHRTLQREVNELDDNNVKVRIIGRRANLPDYLLDEIKQAEGQTADNTGLNLNIAFNYGGRAEIVDAVNEIIKDTQDHISEISPELIGDHLYNPDFQEVEFLIRTGGEMRVSNFMLWEIAYAELYITDKYWPAFQREDFRKALQNFSSRERRFGSLDESGDQ